MYKTYSGEITELKSNQVFVFGANKRGFHGAGAAGYASFNEMGNVWRKHDYANKPNGWKGCWNEKGRVGFQQGTIGKSYGLITIDKPGLKRSIPPDQLIQNISWLYQFASVQPNWEFLISQSNKNGLNGYTYTEMAQFFVEAGEIPLNIVFQDLFYKTLNYKISESK